MSESVVNEQPKVYLDSLFASCAEVAGTVEAKRAQRDSWEPVALGCELKAGDAVRTAEGSRARLRFGRRGSLLLDGQSEVVLYEREQPAVALLGGSLAASAGQGARAIEELVVVDGDSEVTIKARKEASSTSLRLVRGTQALVVIVDEGEASVVLAGVELGVPGGRAVALSGDDAGQPFDIVSDPVLASPAAGEEVDCEAGKTTARWEPVADAISYRVEVADNAEFSDDPRVVATVDPQLELDVRFPASRFWRVAAVDERGLQSEFSSSRFACRRPPQVAAAAKPENGARFVAVGGKSPKIPIEWGTVGGDVEYRVVVGRGDDPMANPVMDHKTRDARAVVAPLAPGRYSWSVYLEGNGTHSLMDAPRTLIVVEPQKPRVDTRGLWD